MNIRATILLLSLFVERCSLKRVVNLSLSPRRNETQQCETLCDHHETNQNYVNCMLQCALVAKQSTVTKEAKRTTLSSTASTSGSSRVYPSAPTDVQLHVFTHRERNEKYLRATVYWTAEPDNRTAFSLSVTVRKDEEDESCEQKFSGFYVQSIPPTARSLEIPTMDSAMQPLLLEYGCAYQIEMHSLPYPYGQSKYANSFVYTVPNCVDSFCDCRGQQEIPAPQNVSVLTFFDETEGHYMAKVSWEYEHPAMADAEPVDTVGNSEKHDPDFPLDEPYELVPEPSIKFHIYLSELFRVVKFANNQKLFKRRPNDVRVQAEKDATHYAIKLPEALLNATEYQIQIFAMNEHFCKSGDVVKRFTLSSVEKPSTMGSTAYVQQQTTAEGWKSDRIDSTTSSLFDQNSKAPVRKVPEEPIDESNSTSPWTAGTTSRSSSVSISVSGKKSREEYLTIFLPIIAFLCLIIAIFVLCRLTSRRRDSLNKKKQYLESIKNLPWTTFGSNTFSNPTMQRNILYTEKEVADAQRNGTADSWEIFSERLKFGRVIGQGAFGLVYAGTADSIHGVSGPLTVAIKQLKTNADEREKNEFLAEICILKQVGNHPNIVSMLGCCTLIYPYCMVMEYVPFGDLLHYLRNLRKEYEQKSRKSRRLSLLHSPARNPETSRIALRSLRAADIMSASGTCQSNSDCQCGVCETAMLPNEQIPFADDADALSSISGGFGTSTSSNPFLQPALNYTLHSGELQSFALQVSKGMEHLESLRITHRDLATRNILVGHGKALKISDFGLSRVGVYVKTTSGRIPLRWLSIEAMRDHIYTTKSDVWAYGIVLWEICTLGGFPYPAVADKDLLRYLEAGRRLDKPESCSSLIYDLMLQCWAYNPGDRPSFSHMRQKLQEWNRHASPYVEFSAVEPVALPEMGYAKSSSPSQALQLQVQQRGSDVSDDAVAIWQSS